VGRPVWALTAHVNWRKAGHPRRLCCTCSAVGADQGGYGLYRLRGSPLAGSKNRKRVGLSSTCRPDSASLSKTSFRR